jgi:uncharacterized coiled-coil protein SlyX
MSAPNNPSQPGDLDLLMQRLRTLQLRLNSVDPAAQQAASERVLEWRSLAGETRARENRRTQLYGAVTGGASDATHDFAQRFEFDFLPKLTQSLSTLLPQIQQTADSISTSRALRLEDDYGSRLVALERRTAEADAQLAELRQACLDGYKGMAEVNERLDAIWDNQEKEGIGGWRVVMKTASLEKEANYKTPMDAFREEAFDDEFAADTKGKTCPVCGEPKGRRKHRTGIMDDLLGLISIDPYQCKRCYCRFYRLNLKSRA